MVVVARQGTPLSSNDIIHHQATKQNKKKKNRKKRKGVTLSFFSRYFKNGLKVIAAVICVGLKSTDMELSTQALRIYYASWGKLHSSRVQRGGQRLHRSLMLIQMIESSSDLYYSALASAQGGQQVAASPTETRAARARRTSTRRAAKRAWLSPSDERLIPSSFSSSSEDSH